ncbi:glycosyl transferase [bacterium]|nr:glycosyl transferase [bacterium]
MSTVAVLIPGVLASVLLSAALCRAVIELGVRDAPDGVRKVQEAPVPTSGGIGFAAATVLVALVGSGFVDWRASEGVVVSAVAAFCAMLVGAFDDARDIASGVKLALLGGIALLAAGGGLVVAEMHPAPDIVWVLPVVVGAMGSVLWLLVVVNAVNFMDGANGLAMGTAAIACGGLGVVALSVGLPDIALLSTAAAGALCGFLFWNVPGRLYAGDAGALFVGALFASLSLALVKARPDLLWIPPTLAAPFLVDVILTVVWRARRGRNVMSAHRDHVYQIAMRAGLSHTGVASVHWIGALNAAAIAIVATLAGGWVPLLAFLGVTAVGVYVNLRVRKSAEARGYAL